MSGLQAVSFFDAMGNIDGNLGAHGPQEIIQHGGGRHAVNVVITKNQDLFVIDDGLINAFYSCIHVLEKKRRACLA